MEIRFKISKDFEDNEDYFKAKEIDLCIFCDDQPETHGLNETEYLHHTLIYNSRMKNNMIYERLKDKVIVLRCLNNHYDIVEDLGKYLFGRRANFCRKCMKCISNALNHVCLTENVCIKCYSDCNVDNSTVSNSTKCPLCDVYFLNKTCLSQHYSVTEV